MKFTLLIIITISVSSIGEVIARQNECFYIENVRIYQTDKFYEEMDVLVVGEDIEKVSVDITSDCRKIDGEGKTLLPGLVNAHVHAWIPYHLRNAVQYGVYTLQDMHSMNETTSQLKSYEGKQGYATIYGAGYAATVAKGHGTQFGYEVPVIGPQRNCFEFVDEQVAAGMDHIKIIFEPAVPTLSLPQIDSLIKRSHFHQKKAVVHISSAADALAVLRLGADGLVHMWRDRVMTDEELKEVAATGAFIIPTLSVLEKGIVYLEEKGIKRERLSMNQLLDEINRIYKSGITLLAGTDPPNFGLDYGKSLHHELVLLGKSGIPVADVVKTATINPYEVYGYSFNGISVGNKASFFLVNGNPETDLSNTSDILIRWMNGKQIKELKEY